MISVRATFLLLCFCRYVICRLRVGDLWSPFCLVLAIINRKPLNPRLQIRDSWWTPAAARLYRVVFDLYLKGTRYNRPQEAQRS